LKTPRFYLILTFLSVLYNIDINVNFPTKGVLWMTRTEKRMMDTRQRILEAALLTFETTGYQNARVTQIAELADIGYGTFYQYFENKKILLLYMLEEMHKHIGDYGFLKQHKGLSLRDRLYYGVLNILKFYADNRVVFNALREAEASDKDFSEGLNQLHQKLFNRVSYDINYFIKKGYCRSEVNDTIIVAISCMIEGYVQRLMDQPGLADDIGKIANSLTEVSYRVLFDDNRTTRKEEN